jgi:hypothetical protein
MSRFTAVEKLISVEEGGLPRRSKHQTVQTAIQCYAAEAATFEKYVVTVPVESGMH